MACFGNLFNDENGCWWIILILLVLCCCNND